MNQVQIAAALREIPLFRELDAPALSEVAALTQSRTYPPNTALFHAGDPGHMLYVIVEGQVRIEKITAAGETVHLAHRGKGDHFGELALLDGKPRMAGAVSVSKCICLTLERHLFQECLRRSPAVSFQIMAALADRLRAAAQDLEDVQELDVLGRLCKLLLELAPEGSGTALRITHQEMADRIGATRESVTRALSGLRKSGLIETSGSRLTLLNFKALRRRCAA